MGIAHDAKVAIGHALENVHAGAEKLAWHKVAKDAPVQLGVSSATFEPNGKLPAACTADGSETPPAITWSDAPAGTQSYVVFCEDPDAPFPEPFVHWMVYGIPAAASTLDGAAASSWRQGENSKLKTGYAGAAPPAGHGIHHYHFQVFALDQQIEAEPGVGRGKLLDQMKGHVLAWGEIIGTYERN